MVGGERRLLPGPRVFAAVLGAMLFLAACAGDEPSTGSTEPVDIAVVLYTKEIPYYQEMLEGMDTTAQQLGVNLQVQHASFDVTREIDLMQNAIVTRPDAIIMAPIDRAALIPPTRQAHEADIPVVLVGDELGQEGREFVVTYVGQIFRDMGEKKARWLVEALGGKGKVLIVHGPRGLDYVEAQREAYEEVFAEFPEIEVVEGSYGDWSSEHGLNTAQNLLAANPDADAIWFDNDDLAIGGIGAVRERKIPFDEILIASGDGAKVAWEAVKRGEIDYTITIRPYVVGLTAVKVVHDYVVEGEKPSYPVKVEMFGVTADNAHDLKWKDIR
jgi:ABC-type sugar transport system substrate-binding protein